MGTFFLRLDRVCRKRRRPFSKLGRSQKAKVIKTAYTVIESVCDTFCPGQRMELLDAIVLAHRTYRRKYERGMGNESGFIGSAVNDPRWMAFDDEGEDDDESSIDSERRVPNATSVNGQRTDMMMKPDWGAAHSWIPEYDMGAARQYVSRDPANTPFMNSIIMTTRGAYDPSSASMPQHGFRYGSPTRHLDPGSARLQAPPNLYLGAQGGGISPAFLAANPHLARGLPTTNGIPHLEEAMILERMRLLTGNAGVHCL